MLDVFLAMWVSAYLFVLANGHFYREEREKTSLSVTV